MTMPTQYQVINNTAQNTMGGTHFHTPQSVFQHMMGQQKKSDESSTWTQVSPVPSTCVSWSITNFPQPHFVRFTGENKLVSCNPVIHQKRKLDVTDITTMRPTKQFISEEKMAEHFSDMHISSNYNPTPVPSTSHNYNRQPLTSSQVALNINGNSGDLENGKGIQPKLVISDELKRLQQESLLPASLLSKLDRPSMALVLWEPPTKILKIFPTSQLQSQLSCANNEDNNNNNANNNNPRFSDSNRTECNSNVTKLEPMDL
ncbi:hypothetical protein PV328_000027 [Microctonus aethiopoides]|uniref:Uncharacterized protein n=1 Tax=Microctonus aethiopoides TaxID=144406 RepID=A0AA39KW00_9HYME|nr:hypothetical protein PV328_000027 [Microctonus aethiopoides]